MTLPPEQLAEARALLLADETDDRDEAIALLLLMVAANEALAEAVDRWCDGTGVWSDVTATATETITGGYAEAHRLGRSLAGDAAEDAAGDMAAALMFWHGSNGVPGEVRYWEGFTTAVQAGEYGEPGSESNPPKREALKRRAQSYTRRFRTLAYAGWVAALGEGALIDWLLGDPQTAHCPDCPEIAAGGPYTSETLPTLPGSSMLTCNSLCLCSLRSGDKVGF